MQVLLVDRFPEKMLKQLENLPAELIYLPSIDRAGILERMPGVDVLVMNSKTRVDQELLDRAPRLKLLCRAGVGMDHFDLPLLKQRGVKVVNTPGANAIPVGEQTVGMLLCLMHNVARADGQVRRFKWLREENRGTELRGKTVGLIGYGNTGSAVGQNLSGFGCRVLAYDKYKTGFGTAAIQEVSLEKIQEEADVLSLHVPLTEETEAWVNEEFLARFRKQIYLMNLARGPIVPLVGLLASLESGQVVAAGLDALENEKLDRLTAPQRQRLDSLFADDRVLFTPHIGGWSHESLDRINQWIVDAVDAFLKNKS